MSIWFLNGNQSDPFTRASNSNLAQVRLGCPRSGHLAINSPTPEDIFCHFAGIYIWLFCTILYGPYIKNLELWKVMLRDTTTFPEFHVSESSFRPPQYKPRNLLWATVVTVCCYKVSDTWQKMLDTFKASHLTQPIYKNLVVHILRKWMTYKYHHY